MMWLGVAWDVLRSYFTDARLYWRRWRIARRARYLRKH
jgi:hypothetical protein